MQKLLVSRANRFFLGNPRLPERSLDDIAPSFLGPCFWSAADHGMSSELKRPKFHRAQVPEIAFAGESNVGKSSLLQALFHPDHRSIVKTSKRPGHTKSLNYFNVRQHRLYLVDMPGYGYFGNYEWGEAMIAYLKENIQLRRLFLLVDCRRGLKDQDKVVIQTLEELTIPYQIVLTKSDAFPPEFLPLRDEVRRKLEQYIEKNTTCCRPDILWTSTKDHTEGLPELRLEILEACGLMKRK